MYVLIVALLSLQSRVGDLSEQAGCTRRGSATATVVSSHGDTHCRSDRFTWNRMLYVLTRVWPPGARVGVATLVLDMASLLPQTQCRPPVIISDCCRFYWCSLVSILFLLGCACRVMGWWLLGEYRSHGVTPGKWWRAVIPVQSNTNWSRVVMNCCSDLFNRSYQPLLLFFLDLSSVFKIKCLKQGRKYS